VRTVRKPDSKGILGPPQGQFATLGSAVPRGNAQAFAVLRLTGNDFPVRKILAALA